MGTLFQQDLRLNSITFVYPFQCGHCGKNVSEKLFSFQIHSVDPYIFEATATCHNCRKRSVILVQGKRFKPSNQYIHLKSSPDWTVTSQQPLPKVANTPEHTPERICKYFVKAKQYVLDGDFISADPIISKTFEVLLQDIESENDALKGKGGYAQRVKDIFKTNTVHPSLQEWFNEIKDSRNEFTHGDTDPSPEEITEFVDFIEVFLQYLYTLPERIKISRKD